MSKKLTNPKNRSALWSVLKRWQKSLEHNRGARAELRRAKSPLDVYVSTAFRRGLVPLLGKDFELSEDELQSLALPVGVLAHARTLAKDIPFATLLAMTDKGSESMRDVRFRKLLSVGDDDHTGLYKMLIRLLKLADGKASLDGLVYGSMFWNEKTRYQWAEAYYSVHNKK